MNNTQTTFNLNATHNWWGSTTGPGGVGPGSGDSVSTNVTYTPWINASVSGALAATVTGSGTFDATAQSDIEIIYSATGTVDITAAKYSSNPGTATSFSTPTGGYIDVYVPNIANLVNLTVRKYYKDSELGGITESSMTMKFYNATSGTWVEASNTGVNTTDQKGYSGYVWVFLNASTTPSITDLTGSVFGLGASIAAPPPSGAGGGVLPVSPGEEVLLVANSIDSALASEFLAYLKANNIIATVINASDFTDAVKVENRLIILLGGPDAYEGIGAIVSDVLSDAEEAAVRAAGAQTMYVKYNAYTDRYSYNQVVIIVAGSDRSNTQAAETKYNVDVKAKVLS